MVGVGPAHASGYVSPLHGPRCACSVAGLYTQLTVSLDSQRYLAPLAIVLRSLQVRVVQVLKLRISCKAHNGQNLRRSKKKIHHNLPSVSRRKSKPLCSTDPKSITPLQQVQLSSAAAERVFSNLEVSFGPQQDDSLQDYIQCYNLINSECGLCHVSST